jgi:hypothetical protein
MAWKRGSHFPLSHRDDSLTLPLPAGEHDDAVGQVDRFVDPMSDEQHRLPSRHSPPQRSDMRFAKLASALAIVVCAAVFGVIVLQGTFFSGQAPFPAQTAPADGQAPALMRADAPATNASGAGATASIVIAAQAPPPPAYPPVEVLSSCEGNPNALGISWLRIGSS